MNKEIIIALIIITWILAGLTTTVIACMIDLRNIPYDEELFNKYIKDSFFAMIFCIVTGYIGLIIVIILYLYEKCKSTETVNKLISVISKILYRLVNIGIKKELETNK